MKLVSWVALKVTLLFICLVGSHICALAQDPDNEIVQITLQGSDLDSFSMKVDGNNVTINGKKPEESGISLTISRQKAGKPGSISANGQINISPPMERGQPYLGIVTQEVDKGVQIIEISEFGPAKKARLQIGDKIVMIDDIRITTHEQLVDLISSKYSGDVINVKYERRGKPYKIDIVLGVRSNGVTTRDPRKVDVQNERPRSLGIKLRETVEGKNWKVIEVTPHSAGDRAGIRVNDIILEMNGLKIVSATDVEKVLKLSPSDQGIQLKVRRIKEILNLEIK